MARMLSMVAGALAVLAAVLVAVTVFLARDCTRCELANDRLHRVRRAPAHTRLSQGCSETVHLNMISILDAVLWPGHCAHLRR